MTKSNEFDLVSMMGHVLRMKWVILGAAVVGGLAASGFDLVSPVYETDVLLPPSTVDAGYLNDPVKINASLVEAFVSPELSSEYATVFVHSLREASDKGVEHAKIALAEFQRFGKTDEEMVSGFAGYLARKMAEELEIGVVGRKIGQQFVYRWTPEGGRRWRFMYVGSLEGAGSAVLIASVRAFNALVTAYNIRQQDIRNANFVKQIQAIRSAIDEPKRSITEEKKKFFAKYVEAKVRLSTLKAELQSLERAKGGVQTGMPGTNYSPLLLVEGKEGITGESLDSMEISQITTAIAVLTKQNVISAEKGLVYMQMARESMSQIFDLRSEFEVPNYIFNSMQEALKVTVLEAATPMNRMLYLLRGISDEERQIKNLAQSGSVDRRNTRWMLFGILGAFLGVSLVLVGIIGGMLRRALAPN